MRNLKQVCQGKPGGHRQSETVRSTAQLELCEDLAPDVLAPRPLGEEFDCVGLLFEVWLRTTVGFSESSFSEKCLGLGLSLFFTFPSRDFDDPSPEADATLQK